MRPSNSLNRRPLHIQLSRETKLTEDEAVQQWEETAERLGVILSAHLDDTTLHQASTLNEILTEHVDKPVVFQKAPQDQALYWMSSRQLTENELQEVWKSYRILQNTW
jgi:hypothetical protein